MKKYMMRDLIHHQIICTRIILDDTSVMIPMRFSMGFGCSFFRRRLKA